MKKFTLLFLLVLIYSISTNAQCVDDPADQYPTGPAYTINICNSVYNNVITGDGWAGGEYSLVSVNDEENYEFRSSVSTDYITITDETGTTIHKFGTTPLLWTSDVTGNIRFYTHTDAACGTSTIGRSRSVVCGAGLLSNEDFTFQDFKFYPNPAKSKISINAKEVINEVSIYNLVGQEVIKITPFALSDEIDLTGLTKGTYFMNVDIKGSSGILKLIKI